MRSAPKARRLAGGAMTSVDEINAMPRDAFVAAFGDVAEHSPWVAEKAWEKRPFRRSRSADPAFAQAMHEAAREAQLALIRAHPDLATRARLTADSTSEQAGAGLDRLGADGICTLHGAQ